MHYGNDIAETKKMNPYYEQKILNAEPIELTRLIYQHAISSVREAREHLRNKQIRERSNAIMRAYAAIAELISSIKPEAAPELSARLKGLYFYMQQRLLDANLQQADAPLAEVLGLLNTLLEAWSGAAAQMASKAASRTEASADPWRAAGAESRVSNYAVSA